MTKYIDDVERREQEKAIREYSEQIVCETCLFSEQCDCINYTPVCLLGDDNRRKAVDDLWGFPTQSAEKILCDSIICVGIGDFLNRFSEKKDLFEEMHLSLPLTNENYIVSLEILDNKIPAVTVYNTNTVTYKLPLTAPAELNTVSFPDIQARAVQCIVIDRYYI